MSRYRPGEEIITERGELFIVNAYGEPEFIRMLTERELIDMGLLNPYENRGRGKSLLGGNVATPHMSRNSRTINSGLNGGQSSLLRGANSTSRSLLNREESLSTMGTGKFRGQATNLQYNDEQPINRYNKNSSINTQIGGYRPLMDAPIERLNDTVLTHDTFFSDDKMLLGYNKYTIEGMNSLHSMCMYRLVPPNITADLEKLYKEYGKNEYTTPLDILINTSTLGSLKDQKYIETLYTKLVSNAPAIPNKNILSFRSIREASEEDNDIDFGYVVKLFDSTLEEINRDPNTRNKVLPYFGRVLYVTEKSAIKRELYQSDITINTKLPKESTLVSHLTAYGITDEIYIVTPVAIFRVHKNMTLIDTIKYLPGL